MFENKIEKLNRAYEIYNSNLSEDISDKILAYVRERLNFNKDLYEKLQNDEDHKDINFDELIKIFDNSLTYKKLYKKEKKINKMKNGFIYGEYISSVGNVVVETDKINEIIYYFVIGIITRNTITISDINYFEYDSKHFILNIFKNSIEKFNLDGNILDILPYEECYNKYFDLVIIPEDKKVIKRENTDKVYLYYNKAFTNEIKREIQYLKKNNIEYEILDGDFDKVVNVINKKNALAAIIFTKNQEQAFLFINRVHAKNVFVNSSALEIKKDVKEISLDFYMCKNIMYQLYESNEIIQSNDLRKDEKVNNDIEENIKKGSVNEVAIAIKKENIFVKLLKNIFEIFKK